MRGCYWHWKHALRKHLGSRHLLPLLSSSTEFFNIIQHIYVLPFVPTDEVTAVYEEVILDLVEEAKTTKEDPFLGKDAEVQAFMEYFEKTW